MQILRPLEYHTPKTPWPTLKELDHHRLLPRGNPDVTVGQGAGRFPLSPYCFRDFYSLFPTVLEIQLVGSNTKQYQTENKLLNSFI